jgi:hypothetical protein
VYLLPTWLQNLLPRLLELPRESVILYLDRRIARATESGAWFKQGSIQPIGEPVGAIPVLPKDVPWLREDVRSHALPSGRETFGASPGFRNGMTQ